MILTFHMPPLARGQGDDIISLICDMDSFCPEKFRKIQKMGKLGTAELNQLLISQMGKLE